MPEELREDLNIDELVLVDGLEPSFLSLCAYEGEPYRRGVFSKTWKMQPGNLILRKTSLLQKDHWGRVLPQEPTSYETCLQWAHRLWSYCNGISSEYAVTMSVPLVLALARGSSGWFIVTLDNFWGSDYNHRMRRSSRRKGKVRYFSRMLADLYNIIDTPDVGIECGFPVKKYGIDARMANLAGPPGLAVWFDQFYPCEWTDGKPIACYPDYQRSDPRYPIAIRRAYNSLGILVRALADVGNDEPWYFQDFLDLVLQTSGARANCQDIHEAIFSHPAHALFYTRSSKERLDLVDRTIEEFGLMPYDIKIFGSAGAYFALRQNRLSLDEVVRLQKRLSDATVWRDSEYLYDPAATRPILERLCV